MSTYTVIYRHHVTAGTTVEADDLDGAHEAAELAAETLPTPGGRIGDEYDAAGEWEVDCIEHGRAEVWAQSAVDDERARAAADALRQALAERDEAQAEVERLRLLIGAAVDNAVHVAGALATAAATT